MDTVLGEERTFPAVAEGMQDCQAYLTTILDSPKPQIIMDEIVSNIVRCSGAKTFRFGIVKSADGNTTMTFSDDGKAFDPTKTSDPDVKATAEERPIGGLGLFLVRKMSKELVYERKNGWNVLKVTV